MIKSIHGRTILPKLLKLWSFFSQFKENGLTWRAFSRDSKIFLSSCQVRAQFSQRLMLTSSKKWRELIKKRTLTDLSLSKDSSTHSRSLTEN